MSIRSQTRLQHHPLPPLSLFPSFSSSPENPIISGDGEDTLVPTAVSILRSHRRRSRWNFLKSILPSSGISPSESSSIILHLRNNPHLALRFFIWTRDLSLCNHNLSSYSTIIHILARSRLRSAALSLLRSAIRSNPDTPASSLLQTLTLTYRPCDSAPFVFDLLIQAYLHSQNLDPALSVLRSGGIKPLTSTANSLLRAAARLRGSTAALNLYRELVETFRPNSQTFNALLLGLYRDGRTESNGEILTEMDRFDCRPNAFTYSIRMAGCSDEAEARRLWEEMAERGIRPDTTAYNTLIKVYCDAGEVEKGEELYREMVMEGGLEATGTTSEVLIRGNCRAGNVGAAMVVYEEMKRKGVVMEGEVVDEMIDEMCGEGMVDEGIRVLRGEMGRKEGVVVGGRRRRSYEALIKGLCGAGRMKEAMKLQAEMAGKGMGADEGVYEAFICGYEKAGEFEMADKLRKEMGCRVQLQLGEEDC